MSYQPYATNLSNAMAHAVQNGNATQGINPSIYGYNTTRFYSEFMGYIILIETLINIEILRL